MNIKKEVSIIATIGPSSSNRDVFFDMVKNGLNIVRFNFSWGTEDERLKQINLIRDAEKSFGKKIPIIQDLPGPRVQLKDSHTYNEKEGGTLSLEDKKHIAFGVANNFDYIAASFIGKAEDLVSYRNAIKEFGGKMYLIAKIERKIAIENIDEIIASADAIMIARGDMGNEVPLEQIPFIQESIIQKASNAKKPVIIATQMLFSMTQNPVPERAEVTDVANAVVEGASAVMLSEETTVGKYPVEVVKVMKKIITESEMHLCKNTPTYFGEIKLKEKSQMGKLFIIRHQESEWNEKGLWTGWRDSHLTPYGFEKSEELGHLIKNVKFDYAFASMQVRSIETLSCILDEDCQYDVPTEHVKALNERSYGDYTGNNKWDVEKSIGKDEFEKLRRGWDYPVPNGETLKMVYNRVVPFFIEKVLPLLKNGKNVIIVSHGNAIRALMKYVESIPDDGIDKVEMLFSDILIYDLDDSGHMINKDIYSLKNRKFNIIRYIINLVKNFKK